MDLLRLQAAPQLSMLAELDGEVVAHVFYSPMHIDGAPQAPPIAGLGPVGVDPAVQGRGLGSALIRASLPRCRSLGWRAIFLLGNAEFYERFGFVPASTLGIEYGDPEAEPHFQVLELEKAALAGCSGRARYHPAFEAVEADPG